jgi:hypothetical protein
MRRRPISNRERPTRLRQQEPLSPLLYPRSQAARLLNVSIATLQRLEKSGRLTPIKLNPRSPMASTYYNAAEIAALASGEAANNA